MNCCFKQLGTAPFANGLLHYIHKIRQAAVTSFQNAWRNALMQSGGEAKKGLSSSNARWSSTRSSTRSGPGCAQGPRWKNGCQIFLQICAAHTMCITWFWFARDCARPVHYLRSLPVHDLNISEGAHALQRWKVWNFGIFYLTRALWERANNLRALAVCQQHGDDIVMDLLDEGDELNCKELTEMSIHWFTKYLIQN